MRESYPSSSGDPAIAATTAMRVAADLRRRILAGELVPGQRLKIDDLAIHCAVSHMPIRMALRELEGEGILEMQPHRGAVIRPVDISFVENLYDVREAIEGMLTERCAQRIDAQGREALRSAVDAYENAAPREDAAELLALNLVIHTTINSVAANPEAVRMLAQGRLLIEALRLSYGFGTGRVDRIVVEHRAICNAILKHDRERAGRLARVHCAHARDDLLKAMRSRG